MEEERTRLLTQLKGIATINVGDACTIPQLAEISAAIEAFDSSQVVPRNPKARRAFISAWYEDNASGGRQMDSVTKKMESVAIDDPPAAAAPVKSFLADPFVVRCDAAEGAAKAGPLDGLSFAAKDNIDVIGVPTGNGSPDWQSSSCEHLPSQHSPAVAAMLTAGARLVGKTHMDELAFSVAGENAHYGTMTNPRAVGRTTGGSSSGSAASVAGGYADIALGTDTTGSVRVPAAHCGLYGLRPTHDAISLDGVCSLARSYDTVGFFARSAAHLSAAGDVLLPPPPSSMPAAAASSTVVLIADDALQRYRSDDEPATAEAARAAVLQAATAVADAAGGCVRHIDIGATLLEACPTLKYVWTVRAKTADPEIDGLGALCALQREEQAGEFWAALGAWSDTVDAGLGKRRPALGSDVASRLKWAKDTCTAPTYKKSAQLRATARDEVKQALDALLADGALLCFTPVAGPPPPPGGAAEAGYRARTFELQAVAGVGSLPQMVVPAGECATTQLPIAVTLIGARGHDTRLLTLAAVVGGAVGDKKW